MTTFALSASSLQGPLLQGLSTASNWLPLRSWLIDAEAMRKAKEEKRRLCERGYHDSKDEEYDPNA